MQRRRIRQVVLCVLCLVLPTARAATLPQDHDYQVQLREYLASLKAEDLTVEKREFRVPDVERTDDEKYRLWTLTLLVPPFDVSQPAEQFLLSSIEAEDGIRLPRISPEATAWLAAWDDPINPYLGDEALKRRAFVWVAVDLMMLDRDHEDGKHKRSDFLGGTLIWLAYAYDKAKDALPDGACAAYETGLRKMVGRLEEWGPRGAMTDMDLFAPVGLWYAARALDDPDVERLAVEYSRPLFTDPHFFNEAGYFVDSGGFDVTYNGISLYFAGHALAATGWDFVADALDKAYELRGYMILPEPDGKRAYGPSHFSPRTSGGVPSEQWNRTVKRYAAAMYTDQAMPYVWTVGTRTIEGAAQAVVDKLNGRTGAGAKPPTVWAQSHWSSDLNYVYEGYVKGFYERLVTFQAEHNDLRRTPFRREGTFAGNFGDVIGVAKLDGFGVILHTGPIGRERPGRMYGLSGGALSAFWTPECGSVIMGRQSGQQGRAKRFGWHNWRLWPAHTATGIIANGRVVSTGRIVEPEVAWDVAGDKIIVTVKSTITDGHGSMPDTLLGSIDYRRRFDLSDAGLTISTELTAEGADTLVELYETLPVFFGEPSRRAADENQAILFHVGDEWQEAGTEPVQADAARIVRYGGAVDVTFDRPRRVQLSPEPWRDYYQSAVECRNIMIDLLAAAEEPQPFTRAELTYTVAPSRPQPAPATPR